ILLMDNLTRRKKYATIPNEQSKADIPEGLMQKCDGCHKLYYRKEMKKNLYVCPNCDYHHQLDAGQRINSLFDEDTFKEWDKHLISNTQMNFPEYEEKLKSDKE